MKHNNQYWESRIAKNTWQTYNSLEERNRKLLEMYQEASKSISDELYRVAEKINGGQGVTLTDMHKFNRLGKLQKNFESIAKNLGEQAEAFARSNMQDGGREVYKNASAAISAEAFTVPNQQLMNEMLDRPWHGGSFSERLWKNTAVLASNLNDDLVTGLQQGKTIAEISIALANKMQQGFNVAHRLVRTETIHYLNSAALRSYKDRGVINVEVWAAEDERTCQHCMQYHGKVYPIDRVPVLPIHANCRCKILPVINDDKKEIDYQNQNDIIEGNRFVPAKSIKEANAYARDVLGIANAEYKGVSLEVANAWNEGLFDSLNRFPELRREFGFTGESHERNAMIKKAANEYYLAELRRLNPGWTDAKLAPYAVSSVNKMMRKLAVSSRSYASSWSPSQSWLRPYAGVSINRDNAKNAKKMLESLSRDVSIKFHPVGCDTIRSVLDHEVGHQLDDMLDVKNMPNIQRLFDERTRDQLTDGLSRYAWDNSNRDRYSEMIAEGWAEYCNNPNPRPVAKEIGETIERRYAEWRKTSS